MSRLPEGYSKAFAQAKAEGRDTFTLNGKTYRTMGGRSHGRSIEETRRGSERPAEAPSRSSGTRSTQTESRASTASSSPSTRPRARAASSPRNSQSVSGDPRTSDGYNRKPSVTARQTASTRPAPRPDRIGASNPPTQRNTTNVASAYQSGREQAERDAMNRHSQTRNRQSGQERLRDEFGTLRPSRLRLRFERDQSGRLRLRRGE